MSSPASSAWTEGAGVLAQPPETGALNNQSASDAPGEVAFRLPPTVSDGKYDLRTRLGSGLRAALRARASPRTLVVFLFVILTLTSLSIVPYLAMRRTELLRHQVETVSEPARTLTTRLQLALSVHLAATRGFLLTGEMEHLIRARTALEAARSIVERLQPLAREISPSVIHRLDRVSLLVGRWYGDMRGLVPGAVSRAEFMRQMPAQQLRFEELLAATSALQREINRFSLIYRTDITASQRRGLSIAVALFLISLLAMTAVGWIFWRQRMLIAQIDWARTDAQRRAGEDHALRTAAAAVAAPITTAEVVRQIARGALAATNAEAAYMAKLDGPGSDLQVIAVAGDGAPALASTLPYPNSVAENVIHGRTATLFNLPLPGHDSPYAGARTQGCAVVVPLIDPEGPSGVLALLYDRSYTSIGPDAMARASTFGDLAAVALRKARLLEESEERRQELERMTESRALLLRGFSHDLKNPLWAADGFLQLLDLGVRGNLSDEQQDSVRHARRSLQAAFKLLQDLIDLARAGIGRIELNPAPLDVSDAIAEVVEDHRAGAEAKKIRMELRVDIDLPNLQTDGLRVRQILGNLLSNAIKYTPDNGRVNVCAQRRDIVDDGTHQKWLAAEVTDSGPGIRLEDQALVFQEFVRLDNGSDRPGAGIGLAISQRVAHALGGRITLQSELGAGSTFTLWLPLATD
ncbi:MAG: sensor histidine kinase [Longimicrobiales bacterium]